MCSSAELDALTPVEWGAVDLGREFRIVESRKKAPGLVTGRHCIAHFPGTEKGIPDLPEADVLGLFLKTFEYAHHHAGERGRFRVGYNGLKIGRNNHFHVHAMLPSSDDQLPRLVELPNDTTSGDVWSATLSCGLKYLIKAAGKKSPGLVTGEHYIVVFDGLDTENTAIPREYLRQLLTAAHSHANAISRGTHRYRLMLNGMRVGSQTHTHIHVMLPMEGDVLPPLVARDHDGGDTVKFGA